MTKTKLAIAVAVLAGAALLAGCSSMEAPGGSPSPSQETRGTITMPPTPVIPTPTAFPTPTASPMPSGTTAAEAFPSNGVDPQGVARDPRSEARFLGIIGMGGEPRLDAQGRTYVSVIEAGDGKAPTGDYLLNIVYAGCAEAISNPALTQPADLVQRIVSETAEKLGYTTADEVVAGGYKPVIETGLAELCGTTFASLSGKVE